MTPNGMPTPAPTAVWLQEPESEDKADDEFELDPLDESEEDKLARPALPKTMLPDGSVKLLSPYGQVIVSPSATG